MRLEILASIVALSCAAGGLAGRGLEEPDRIGARVRAAPRIAVETALRSRGWSERCRRVLAAPDLVGTECRARAAAALALQQPVATPADLKDRVSLATDLLTLGASLASFSPLSTPPGFTRARFEAHRAICAAAMDLHDALSAVPPTSPLRAQAETALQKAELKQRACGCAQDTVGLATRADADLAERGAAQAILTSHGCFLDPSRLVVAPRPATPTTSDGRAVDLASRSAAVRSYAASRTLDLRRCTDKLTDAAGHPKDGAKLEACLCGVVQRWRFPQAGGATQAALPIEATGVILAIDVGAHGALEACRLSAGAAP
jgi:hypothetical protein